MGTASKLSWEKSWSIIRQQWLVWVVGIVGIIGNDVAYFAAIQHAPAVQVTLINYLWPVFLVVLLSTLPSEKLSISSVCGTILGILATMLILKPGDALNFNADHMLGYLYAFGGMLTWAGYVLFTQHHQKVPKEMTGIYCGAGALLCAIIHTQCEVWVTPTLSETSLLVIAGLLSGMGAYYCWDYGSKQGNIQLLTVLSYFAPILSVFMLILTGQGHLTSRLGLACVLVCIASFISSVKNISWLSAAWTWLCDKVPFEAKWPLSFNN